MSTPPSGPRESAPPPTASDRLPLSAPASDSVALPTTRLRGAVTTAMWVAVAAHLFVAAAAFLRWRAWNRFDDSSVGDNMRAFHASEDRFSLALLVWLVSTLATAIVLAVWSYRAVSNAQARGADANPTSAAAGWFIPVAWFFVSFHVLRQVVLGRQGASEITRWQLLWAAASLVAAATVQFFDESDVRYVTEMSGVFRNQSIGLAVSTVLLVAATTFAVRSLRAVDDAIPAA